MPASVVSRTLQKAAEILGSRAKLCRFLAVPAAELDLWIADKSEPPKSVFLKAVDLVLGEANLPGESEPGDPPAEREASSASDRSASGFYS